MKLKSFRIWLFLLPLILFVGIILYLQSTSNQRELENHLIRNITATQKDAVRALDDYYKQIDGFFLRQGYSHFSADKSYQDQAIGLVNIIDRNPPKYSNLNYNRPIENEGYDGLIVSDRGLKKLHYQIQLTDKQAEDFRSEAIINGLKIDNSYSDSKGDRPFVDIEIPFSSLFRTKDINKQFDLIYWTDSAGKIIYPKEEAGIKLYEPKTIFKDSLGTTSGVYIDSITFSNVDYRSYVAPVLLEDVTLYAVGMFREDRFQKVGLRINFMMLSTLVFILIVLIAVIPLLSILYLSKGDILSQSKVTNVGVSLLGLALLAGFASSFFRNLPDPATPLITTSNSISCAFRESLEKTTARLKNFNNSSELPNDQENINEALLIDNNARIQKFIFNADSIITIDFSEAKAPSFVDVSDRVYVSFFNKKPCEESTYLGSHYSRASGKLEMVISKRKNDSSIGALTFEADTSLFDEENLDYRFLVIKDDGKIIFKSSKIDTPIENLKDGLNSNKWIQVKSLLENNQEIDSNSELKIPLYLNGYQYTGILKRVDVNGLDRKVWLLFLVNENLTHVFSSLTSLESISLVIIYFLFLILLMVVQRFSTSTVSDKGFKVFIYNWLQPSEENKVKLAYLSVSMVLIGSFFVYIYYEVEINHLTFIFFAGFVAIIISMLNYAVNAISETTEIKDFSRKLPTDHLPFTIMLVLLILLMVLSDRIQQDLYWPYLFLLGMVFILIIGWFTIVKETSLFSKLSDNSIILPIYLSIWFIVIGFFPGYMIQSKTQLFETEIWNPKTEISHESFLEIETDEFEEIRRGMMTSVTDLYDPKIEQFVSPNVKRFSWILSSGIKPKFNFSGAFWVLIGIAFAALLFSFFIYKIQQKVFYRFQWNKKSKALQLKNSLYFISSLDSSELDSITSNAIEIDFLFETEITQLVPVKRESTYHFKNFHSLVDYSGIIGKIQAVKSEIIAKKGKLIISSGLSWKEIFAQITDPRMKIAFSETFADFTFEFLPLKAERSSKNNSLSNEELLQRLRRNKSYYANIWSELNFEEKLACFTYAEEGFFNPAQEDVLSSLSQKGVLVPKSTKPISENHWVEWQLFSPMFRKYILSHVTSEEQKEFKAYEKKFGNTSFIQVSAISFVLICFALIGIFDKNFLNEAYAYLTGSLGLIGSLYAFLSRGFAGFKFGKSEAK